jgi:hypothetical protein
VVTWGETISHVGDVPPQDRQGLGASKVGYKYSYWGVFWVDLWTWGGEYCVYEGDRYLPIPPAEAARLTGKPVNELGTPFLYRFPPGWFILGPLIVIGIIGSVRERRKADRIARLFQDASYQRALEVLKEEYANQAAKPEASQGAAAPPPADGGDRFRAAFEAGVQHLNSVGIPRDEAERNFALLVQALAQAQQHEAAPPSENGAT